MNTESGSEKERVTELLARLVEAGKSAVRQTAAVIKKVPFLARLGIVFFVMLGGLVGWQNYRALSALHSAQSWDKSGNYNKAKVELQSISSLFIAPNLTRSIHAEQKRNQALIATAQKLAQVKELLKEHKTQQALSLLKSIASQSGSSTSSIQAQVAQLQNAAQAQAKEQSTSQAGSGAPSGAPKAGGGSGGTGGGSGGQQGGNQPPPFNGNLSSCPGNLTQGGNYVLTTDLVQTTPTTPCIGVTSLSGVSIDCAGHAITVNAGPVPISFYGVSSFAVKNCHLGLPIGVLASSGGTITGNTLSFSQGSGQSFSLSGVTGTNVTSNTIINGLLLLKNGSSSNTVSNNTISADPTVSSASISGVIEADDSSSNTITGNHLDGSWHGSPDRGPGSDDGIMLKSSPSTTVSSNVISNVFDCGIETIAQASNDQVAANTITNAGVCGIGSFYYTSWLGNVVQGNTISATQLMFQLYIDTNFTISPQETPSTYYFQNNQFISNTFTSGTTSNTNSANMNFASQFLPAGVTAVTGSNQFKDNDFGKFDVGPNLAPQSAIVDLGGNKCAAIPASDPQSITCN